MNRAAAVDTSVMVAALVSWHQMHRQAFRALEPLVRQDRLVLPVPAVIETYAVLTRLPSPHRLAPADAAELLSRSFATANLVGFPTRELWRFLRELVTLGIGGGTSYDAAILECARQGQAESILTFNRRDYERFDIRDIDIVVPGER